jgi:hypothetical protein
MGTERRRLTQPATTCQPMDHTGTAKHTAHDAVEPSDGQHSSRARTAPVTHDGPTETRSNALPDAYRNSRNDDTGTRTGQAPAQSGNSHQRRTTAGRAEIHQPITHHRTQGLARTRNPNPSAQPDNDLSKSQNCYQRPKHVVENCFGQQP